MKSLTGKFKKIWVMVFITQHGIPITQAKMTLSHRFLKK